MMKVMHYFWIVFSALPLFAVADLEKQSPAFVEANSPIETVSNTGPSDPPQPPALPPSFAMPGEYNGRARLAITGEYLYLKTQEEELGYGTTSLNATTQALTDPLSVLNGRVLRMNPGFNSGVRLAATYLIPDTDWNLRVTWMEYSNQTSASTSNYLWPFLLNQTWDPPFASSASGTWDLHLNQLDGDFAVYCFSNQWISLTPRIGVRGAWISQNLDVTYQNVDFTGLTITNVVYSFVKSNNSSTFSGAGLLAGVDVNWVFGKGFSFYTNGTAALLWSTFDLLQRELIPAGTYRSTLNNKVRDVSPVLDLAAGVQWETTAFQGRWLFQCQVGWEEHIWFHQNQFDRFIDTQVMGSVFSDNGNLGLSGVVASLKIGF